ncbi:hypothetical protein GBF38_004938 [Xyrichtys novacula]|uniref:G-protein coupled receptors family 1 profile domain-containing protein n=1 Tax=Xyrichtys novacula TaxID=13765 RepID=A0AAV1EHR4_XYRNO|nr:hypothetical protein GBF38_004938 [Xyrichtys novacula]
MLDNSSSNSTSHYWQSLRACFPIFVAIFLCYILFFLPLLISVLYEGYRRWRKQHSGTTSGTASHADVFTYHMVAMELISVCGSCFYCYGESSNHMVVFMVGMYLWFIIVPGQSLFHILTCVERYLAVVHPVTYLRLKQSGGVRIRNITIGCVWLISMPSSPLCFKTPSARGPERG